jgi:hypothetical protein
MDDTVLDYIDKLNEHIDYIQGIRFWYKYTNNRIFSQREEGMFYEIRRYEDLIFYKTDGKTLYKLNLTKFVEKLIPSIEEDELLKSIIWIRTQIKDIIEILKDSIKDYKPLIKDIFSLPVFEDEIIDIHLKNEVETKKFKDQIELEDYLDDKIEHVSKIECFNMTFHRNEILTDEYREYEYNKLLEQEEYEILSFIKEANKN